MTQTGRFKRATLLQTSTQQQQQNEQRMTPDLQQQEVMQQNINNNQLQQPARNPKSNSDAAEKRVTVMVACMVGAFMAAWTPYSILALFETFIGVAGQHQATRHEANRQMDDEKSTDAEENFFNYVGAISPAFATIPSLFAKTSAVLNPLIYGLLNTQVTILNPLNQIFDNWKINHFLRYAVPIGLGQVSYSILRSSPSLLQHESRTGLLGESNGTSQSASITRFQFHVEAVGDCQRAHERNCSANQQRLAKFHSQPA
jgi:hypothetical protein